MQKTIGVLLTRWNEPPRGSNSNWSIGTGVLIDSTHVLTSAHNLIEVEEGHESIRLTGTRSITTLFYPDFLPDSGAVAGGELSGAPSPGLNVAAAWHPAAYAEKATRPWDIAVLRLDSAHMPNQGGFPTRVQNLEAKILKQASGIFDSQQLSLPALTVRGYNVDGSKPSTKQLSVSVQELDVKTNQIVYANAQQIKSISGSSGAPLYDAQTGTLYGIHHCGSGRTFAVGLFQPILSFIQAALTQQLVKGPFHIKSL
ncbi:trypsin-like serine peptidase [Archangium sp.]|uniref:trypsin-like serine peptidase n=1 Tax=Archangium sp. TaxID=1872627 RepID=UPI00389A4888